MALHQKVCLLRKLSNIKVNSQSLSYNITINSQHTNITLRIQGSVHGRRIPKAISEWLKNQMRTDHSLC